MMNDEKLKKMISWIPPFIRYDFLRKLIALFFAVLVWWKVSSEIGVEEVIRQVPVDISTSPNIMILDDKIPNVDVTLHGSQKLLNLLSPSDIKVKIPIRGVQFEKRRIIKQQIQKTNIVKPSGVEVTRIYPEILVINVDRKASRKVSVKAKFTGSPPEDYACGEVHLIPEYVMVTGPGSEIENITSLQTEAILLDKSTIEDFEYYVDISEGKYRKISINPPKVNARVEIYKKYDTRVFSSVPVRVLGLLDAESSVQKQDPKTVDITVGGLKRALDLMDGSELKPFIDISDFKKSGNFKVKVDCWISLSKVRVTQVNPAELEIKIPELKK